MTDIQSLIKRAREVADKATPGPWYDDRYSKGIRVTSKSIAHSRGYFYIARYPTRTNESLVSHEEWDANSRFIAQSRTLVPELCYALENLVEKGCGISKELFDDVCAERDLAEDREAKLAVKNAELQTENARLREALELIKNDSCSYCRNCAPCGSQHVSVAERTLSGEGGGK